MKPKESNPEIVKPVALRCQRCGRDGNFTRATSADGKTRICLLCAREEVEGYHDGMRWVEPCKGKPVLDSKRQEDVRDNKLSAPSQKDVRAEDAYQPEPFEIAGDR